MRKENHQTFEQLLIESLKKFICREAQERSLESEEDADTDLEQEDLCANILVAPYGSVVDSLGMPLLAGYSPIEKANAEASTSFDEEALPDAHLSLDQELSFIHKAKDDIRARKESWFIKKLVITTSAPS